MNNKRKFSILFPDCDTNDFKIMSPTTFHDIGMDKICSLVTNDSREYRLICDILCKMSKNPQITLYRQQIFNDILNNPDIREKLLDLFKEIEFIRDFGISRKESDEKLGLWELIHRLDELDNYIRCVESMRDCLMSSNIKSEGLINLRK